eukprot:3504703-Amphidinium_carterae.1
MACVGRSVPLLAPDDCDRVLTSWSCLLPCCHPVAESGTRSSVVPLAFFWSSNRGLFSVGYTHRHLRARVGPGTLVVKLTAGVISLGALTNFATDATGFSHLFPGRTTCCAGSTRLV